jgi:hypothetical protein
MREECLSFDNFKALKTHNGKKHNGRENLMVHLGFEAKLEKKLILSKSERGRHRFINKL